MENEIIEQDDIIYHIRKAENASFVAGIKSVIEDLFIPRSIKYLTKEYNVLGILDGALKFSKIKSLRFANDSKLKAIKKNAFTCSTIECIKIPTELIELKEGWCSGTSKLTKIEVSPKNPRYCCFDEKMIIGKTNIEQNNYDCLVFCIRSIEQITIPNFIEHICSYSFDHCKQLESIEFSNDSKLQTIDEYAFYDTGIQNIRIPSSVTFIGRRAFHICQDLESIEIPDDSKLQTIDEEAFSESSIESIKIPSKLIELKEGWCYGTDKLTKIEVSPKNPRYCCFDKKMIIGKTNIEQNNYDCLVFCIRNIKQITIPNFIEHICSCSFDLCYGLKSIEFSNDSKLQTIDEYAFYDTGIQKIRIPSSVTFIGESAFHHCEYLESIEIPNSSILQMINKEAFYNAAIKSITIPSSVTFIGEGAFDNCKQLHIIEIHNTEMITIYQTAFKDCKNSLLMIPFH